MLEHDTGCPHVVPSVEFVVFITSFIKLWVFHFKIHYMFLSPDSLYHCNLYVVSIEMYYCLKSQKSDFIQVKCLHLYHHGSTLGTISSIPRLTNTRIQLRDLRMTGTSYRQDLFVSINLLLTSHQFMNGLNTQWYNTATQIHRNCTSILGTAETNLLQSDTRKIKSHKEIGWVMAIGVYSSVDVPILHKDWSGEYSLSSVFLNPKLMGMSLIFHT